MATEKTFDQQLAGATSAAEIAEICKAQSESAGVLVRERDGSVTVRDNFVVSPTFAPLTASTTANYSKVFYIGNSRFELVADSVQQLEEQERRILQLFGR